MSKPIRTFIAIELPEDVKAAIAAAQRGFIESNLPFKWVKPKSMHLTLKFLGNVFESNIDEIHKVMAQCTAGFSPMAFSAHGFGVFPGFKKPRVLWTGMRGDTRGLVRLASDLEQGLEGLGFPREKRRYSAHITLGRAKGRVNAASVMSAIEKAGEFSTPEFQASCVNLYKSDLTPSGAVYTKMAQAILGESVP